MQTCYKLPLSFDPKRLAEDLAKVSEDEWMSHSVKIHYNDGWGGVALQSGSGRADDLDPSPHGLASYRPTPVLERCDYLQEVVGSFRCQLSRIRLLKLGVGTVVKEHVDEGFGRDQNQVRVHVPIQTNPGVEFYSNGKRVVMGAGECWFLDTTFPHSLANHGDADRIHLVLDCVLNDWVLSVFPEGFAKPSIMRRVSRKARVVRFMVKDIYRAATDHNRIEFRRRVKRLLNELGLRWARGLLGRARA